MHTTIMKYKILLLCFLLFISVSVFSQATTTADTVNDNQVIFTEPEIEASFPGGQNAWLKYVFKQITGNMNELTSDNRPGTCRVRFIVDKEGKVSDINALNMKRSVLAKIAVKAIANGPKWIPAMQNGRPVKSYKEQSITFKTKNP